MAWHGMEYPGKTKCERRGSERKRKWKWKCKGSTLFHSPSIAIATQTKTETETETHIQNTSITLITHYTSTYIHPSIYRYIQASLLYHHLLGSCSSPTLPRWRYPLNPPSTTPPSSPLLCRPSVGDRRGNKRGVCFMCDNIACLCLCEKWGGVEM